MPAAALWRLVNADWEIDGWEIHEIKMSGRVHSERRGRIESDLAT